MNMLKHLVVAGCTALCAQGTALAQAWPSKPVKLIVANGAGTPPDVLARALAQRWERRFGQPFVVENRPGANTLIGMQACAQAVPDAYTFCITTNDSVSINPHLFSRLPYDPDKSFEPVAILAWPHSVIVATSSVPARTFKDVVALSKAKPGRLNWGSFGNGSSSHLYLEWIRSRTGWDVTHVPYTGSAMLRAALAGEVQLTYLAIGALKPHIDSGKLHPIAVAGNERSPFLPDVPTFSEVGLGRFFVRTWFGLFAPTGTPTSAVVQMNRAALDALADPQFKSTVLDPLTVTAGKETPAEVREFLKVDRLAGAALVKAAKLKLD